MAARDVQALTGELRAWAEASGLRPVTHVYGDGPEQVAELLLPSGSADRERRPAARGTGTGTE
ncbi:MAG: hypothetical protein ACRDL5_05045, partial [Solirubrobacteraceae bacterium]